MKDVISKGIFAVRLKTKVDLRVLLSLLGSAGILGVYEVDFFSTRRCAIVCRIQSANCELR